MAIFTNKELAKVTLGTVLTTVYTVPAATTTIVTVITVANANGLGVTRKVIVKLGGKFLLASYPLADGETFSISDPHVLPTTELIQVSQDVGADVDLIASGIEIT